MRQKMTARETDIVQFSGQRGAVLVTSLMILLILTLLGVTAMQMMALEEKMTGNFAQKDIAFQRAEAGVRDAEDFLRGDLPVFDNTGGLYAAPVEGRWEGLAWDNTDSLLYSRPDELNADKNPRYYIEQIIATPADGGSLAVDALSDENILFRITARGQGDGASSAEVILQSTFRVSQ